MRSTLCVTTSLVCSEQIGSEVLTCVPLTYCMCSKHTLSIWTRQTWHICPIVWLHIVLWQQPGSTGCLVMVCAGLAHGWTCGLIFYNWVISLINQFICILFGKHMWPSTSGDTRIFIFIWYIYVAQCTHYFNPEEAAPVAIHVGTIWLSPPSCSLGLPSSSNIWSFYLLTLILHYFASLY